jgi:hypothetical protein
VATWVWLDEPAGGEAAAEGADGAVDAADGAVVPLEVVLGRVPLAPGQLERIRETLVVPEPAGRWALVVDIVDDVAGSFAALGSAPAVALFEVVPARGIEPVE